LWHKLPQLYRNKSD